MGEGQIIFLNGASSSGKSTVAKALQEALEEPYMHVSVDRFFEMLHPRFHEAQLPREVMMAVMQGFHRSVAGLASAGNNVIVDHVLAGKPFLRECIALMGDMPVLFVGVHAPLEVLKQRELERGDRHVGLAEFQYERVHQDITYDIEIDTSASNPEECAQQIIDALGAEREGPSAFARIRDAMAAEAV
jgi:chloramphenicol 3-O phosphotransferase